MYRIDNSTAATSLPTPGAATGLNGYFTLGNPAGGVPATIVDQDWANAVQEELCNAVTGAGITLSKTSRNQLATAIGDLIAVETSRAETAEALKAPIASPVFTGNGSIVGSFTVGTTMQAAIVQTTSTGYLNIGTGASLIQGTLTVDGAATFGGNITAASGQVYASALATTGSGSAAIGTGGLTNSGSETVAGSITSTGGNITSNVGTVTGVNLHFTSELYGPSFSVISGNVNATSGTVTAIDLTATSTVSAAAVSCSGTGYFTGQLTSATEINNPWFSSTGSDFLITTPLTVNSSGTYAAGLTVNGGTLTATDNCTVYGTWTLTNGASTGEMQCYVYGSSAAFVSSIGIAGGPTSYTLAIAGYCLNSSGPTPYSAGFGSQFGFMTQSSSQAIAFYATSDYRLKENISAISPEAGRAFVKKVTPSGFNWKVDGQYATGYVAQELIARGYDHLVSVLPNEDLEESITTYGEDEVTARKGVQLIAKYDDVIAYLHAALQDAQFRIEALEARLG